MKNSALAIIPARGGSKRIPRKNIKDFFGQPIIKYSIDAAIASGCFEEIMVSTDDEQIARVALKFGAQVPFMRSQETSDDHAMLGDVVEEVLTCYSRQNKIFNYFCCVLPTAPFITPERIKYGMKVLTSSDADAAIPVVRFGYPVQRALKIEDGKLSMIWNENYNRRSQDLIPAYHDAGQFYWLNTETFLKTKNMFGKNSVPIVIEESHAQDIDTEEDWVAAELKYKIINKTTE